MRGEMHRPWVFRLRTGWDFKPAHRKAQCERWCGPARRSGCRTDSAALRQVGEPDLRNREIDVHGLLVVQVGADSLFLPGPARGAGTDDGLGRRAELPGAELPPRSGEDWRWRALLPLQRGPAVPRRDR